MEKKANKYFIQQALKLTWIQLSMYCFCIYVIYSKSIYFIGYQYGRLSMILIVMSLFTLLMHDKKILINRYITIEFIILIVTTFTSLFVVESTGELLNVTSTIFDGIIIGYSNKNRNYEKNIDL